jgi:hypothetical protein
MEMTIRDASIAVDNVSGSRDIEQAARCWV